MTSTILPCLGLTAMLAAQQIPCQAPWPDFRGPTRDGHAPGAKVPLRWGDDENVRWKTRIHGTGWSSPVVLGGQVWLTTATPDGKKQFAVALDVKTGKVLHDRELWDVEAPAHKNRLNSYASPSPVVEPGRVYVHFGTYGTACLDTETGKTLWERHDLECDHMEGPGSSPILWRDLLIFNVDGGDVQYVVALDKKTGKTRWKTDRSVGLSHLMPDLRKAYSTPIVIDAGGGPRLVSSGAQATYLYDPATGKELWRFRYRGFSMSSRPLYADGVLYLNTGFMRAQLLAVRATGKGDVTDDNLVWHYRRNVPTMPSKLLVGGRIYMVNDSGIATCIDAKTGERIWRERLDGQYCASPVYAAHRIYFFDREGRTVVIAPGDRFHELAENQLGDGFMASPAIVGDAFILRSRTHVYRVESR